MTLNNKLDSFFGTIGTFAGIILFIAGIISVFLSLLIGIILILTGSFIGFSYTSSILDFDKKRIKISNNLFGFISFGKWIEINKDSKIGFKLNNITLRTYSLSNRTSEIEQSDYRIILYDKNNIELAEIKKVKNINIAEIEVEKLSKEFNIGIL